MCSLARQPISSIVLTTKFRVREKYRQGRARVSNSVEQGTDSPRVGFDGTRK